MKQEDVLQILADVGAVITGSHIVYTSGKHGSAYVNKDAVYPHTEAISLLCEAIAGKFFRNGENVEVVVAPALGGIVLTQWVAHHLTRLAGREVLAVYAEKMPDGNFAFTRGYDKLVARKRILVVEDILNTGGSARKVVDLVRSRGWVVGVGALCNRGGVTAEDLGVPKLTALVDVNLDAWDEHECSLCAQNVPVNTTVGKGKDFLARQAASNEGRGCPVHSE